MLFFACASILSSPPGGVLQLQTSEGTPCIIKATMEADGSAFLNSTCRLATPESLAQNQEMELIKTRLFATETRLAALEHAVFAPPSAPSPPAVPPSVPPS